MWRRLRLLLTRLGATDNITIGDNVIIAEKAAATKDLPGDSVYWGNPAHPIKDERKVIVLSRKLPVMFDELNELKERISVLESRES